MDECTEPIEERAIELGGKIAKGTDPVSVSAREVMIANITDKGESKSSMNLLSGNLSDEELAQWYAQEIERRKAAISQPGDSSDGARPSN